ncbi:unnamed protein product [Peniophora sp. CBMAI 1063]|nr:unnamed protein product [Peniophora sp. CBMAI 1063]
MLDTEPRVFGIEDLPAELLGRIFIETADLLSDVDNVKLNTPPCTYLSHVCSRWRVVALDCQELWARFLPLPNVQWTTACLARCPDNPLYVTIDHRYKRSNEYRKAAELVLAHWNRVKIFDLTFTVGIDFAVGPMGHMSTHGQALLRALLERIAQPNDVLQSLHLRLRAHDMNFDTWNPVHLTTELFAAQYPRLIEIELGQCILPSKPPTVFFNTTLRVLELDHIRAWDDIDSMIDYLHAVPMLESLSYAYWSDSGERTLFECQPSRVHEPRCVKLPHLAHLALVGHWMHTFAILNYVSFPSRCDIAIGTGMGIFELEGADEIELDVVRWHIETGAETLKQHFSAATLVGCSYSHIQLSPHRVVGEDPCTIDGSPLPLHVQPSITLPIPTALPEIQKDIFKMYASLPIFARPRSTHFNEVIWRDFPAYYGSYEAVQELVLSKSRHAASFVSALIEKGAALFPTLRRVVLEDINFMNKVALVRQLVDALCRHHADMGVGQFECLVLRRCPCVTKDFVDELGGRLGRRRVEWDCYVDALSQLREQARQERLQAGEPLHDASVEIFDYEDYGSDWEG